MPKISLVIATFNGADRILPTLESVAAQTLDRPLWNVVVVNNNSSDNTAEVVEKFIAAHPDIDMKMVDEPCQGLSVARNRGIDTSDGDYIAIIDDDETASPDLLKTYFDFLDTHPYAVAAGGRILPEYLAARPSWVSKWTERPIAGTLDLGRDIILFPHDKYFGGGNMALRRTAIEYYGNFNTELGRRGTKLLGGEEKELYMRYYASGEDIYYLPKALIRHRISAEKLTEHYFSALCYRIGQSERIRTLGKSRNDFRRRLWSEYFKWCVTIVLCAFFFLTMQPSKAKYLWLMRRRISAGLRDADTGQTL